MTGEQSGYELPEELWERVLSPALVIYLDRVRHNVRTVIEQTGGADRWRPHVKTAKIPEVFRELCRAGIRNFKCATTREARELLQVMRAESVSNGDLLVAYPLPAPALTVMESLAEEYSEFRLSVLAEDATNIDAIPSPLSIFVDVNPGMHRTGIPAHNFDEIKAVATLAGSRFRGVHFYDGHLHQDDIELRRRSAFECYDQLVELVRRLESTGTSVDEIITSGTPSYRHALAYPHFGDLGSTLHRVSPGTVVYFDLRSQELEPDCGLQPAALVHSRVISVPNETTVTCDAGSKSIAAEAGDPVAHALGHPELRALTPSEEHLPFELVSGSAPARGTALMLFPRHICPTVNLASQAVLMDQDGFARVVDVSARAHDLLIGD